MIIFDRQKRLLFCCVRLALMVSVLCLSSCIRTVRTRYYLLSATASANDSVLALPSGGRLFLRHCKLPDYLQRSEMVVRKHPHEITFLEFDVWGQRLEKMIEQVLRENLLLLAGVGQVADAAQVMPSKSEWVLDYDFLQLEANRKGELVTVVDCKLHPPESAETKSWRMAFAVPLEKKQGREITAAVNEALAKIAVETVAKMQ